MVLAFFGLMLAACAQSNSPPRGDVRINYLFDKNTCFNITQKAITPVNPTPERILHSLKDRPDDEKWQKLNDYGVVFAIADELNVAAQLLQAAVEANPSSAILLENMGDVYLLMARHQYSAHVAGRLRQPSAIEKFKLMERFSMYSEISALPGSLETPAPPRLQDKLLSLKTFSNVNALCSDLRQLGTG